MRAIGGAPGRCGTTGAWVVLGLVALLGAAPAAAQGPSGSAGSAPRVIEVRMVDKGPTQFAFEPSEIRVRPGDRVVWVQTGVMPHNVQFTQAPSAVTLAGLPVSPFLTMKGQQYEVVIDDRFQVGKYDYKCTPHAGMGMIGTLTVVAAGSK